MLLVLEIDAQICTVNDIFETQTELDQFLMDNPTCTVIDGDVFITVGMLLNPDPIVNLDAFQNITQVTGTLGLSDFQFPSVDHISLTGLSNLQSAGALEIYSGEALNDLTGLNNVTTLGSLYVDAYSLNSISALDAISSVNDITLNLSSGTSLPLPSFTNVLPNVQTVSESLTIGSWNQSYSFCDVFSGFDALTSVNNLNIGIDAVHINYFDAFHHLESIGSFYSNIFECNAISAFENVQTIGDIDVAFYCECDWPDFESVTTANSISLYGDFWSGPDFNSLTEANHIQFWGTSTRMGFINLETINGVLDITQWQNPELDVIDANALQYIGGNLIITNTNISNLDFLSNVTHIGGTIDISANYNLSNCEVQIVCDMLATSPDSVLIGTWGSNGMGCNSNEEVMATCGDSYVEGVVFVDVDCDGVFNNTDINWVNPIMHNANSPVGSSNQNGEYFVPLNDNSSTTIQVSTLPGYTSLPQTFVTTGVTDLFTGVNFPVCPQPNLHNVAVSISAGSTVRPGFSHWYYVNVTNYGVFTEEVEVVFSWDDMPGVFYVSDNSSGILTGNTITWNIADIDPFETHTILLRLQLDSSTPLGTMLSADVAATILPLTATDIDLSNNQFEWNQTVVGSFDPNDISVNIQSFNIGNNNPEDQLTLDYVIQFQNTGTADAINIHVDDYLEEDLELSSIELIATSHACVMSFDDNRQVSWLFENILLPDVNTDEEASHGYIHYRIKTKNNLQVSDIIENNAAIYFDFNEPVITNTATTIFYECTQNVEIIGVADVCEGSDVTLTSSGVWNDYLWTMNGNSIGTSNQLTIADLSAGQQTISLNVTDTYCSGDAEFVIDVTGIPSTPVITQSGNTLTASGNGIFTWTFNGEALAENDNSIEITESGVYGVSVMESMCVSGMASGSFEYVHVEESTADYTLKCYPNPANDVLYIEWPDTWTGQNQIMLTDLIGKVMVISNSTKNRVSLNLTTLASGTYQIVVINEDEGHVLTKQIFVE
ncbi:MAG: T9SS type A sorting domain-containing protein [Flavobacteriales bacterium]|nr:T9SS type A sorting domain-containing protein [Flavobacteriales bacterium]